MALVVLRTATFEERPFRIALLDHHMPGMSGEDLARAIRADTAMADTGLILATSSSLRGDAARAQAAGFDAFLTKPIAPDLLAQCLSCVAAGSPWTQPERHRPLVTSHAVQEARRKVRILLAEDNRTNQMIAISMLERMGYRVDVASNGLEAVEAFRTCPYDLVLMDVMMPEMDGLAATQAIRAQFNDRADVPILALTANAFAQDREACLAAGMNGFIVKPVTADRLGEAIGQAIAGVFSDGVQEQAKEHQGPMFDSEMLDRLVQGIGQDGVAEVLQIFLEETTSRLIRMTAQVGKGDLMALREEAHSLKSAAASIGLAGLSIEAGRLEAAAAVGDDPSVINLSSLFARSVDWLQQWQVVETSTV